MFWQIQLYIHISTIVTPFTTDLLMLNGGKHNINLFHCERSCFLLVANDLIDAYRLTNEMLHHQTYDTVDNATKYQLYQDAIQNLEFLKSFLN